MLARRWAVLPGNALAAALAGHAVWSVGEQLMAELADRVAVGNYYLAKQAGAKSVKKPKPIPRPWDKKPQSFGSGAIPIDQIDGWIRSTIREE